MQLCEGHRLDWQNILRDQPGSVADIDVVSSPVAVYHCVFSHHPCLVQVTALATFAIQLCRKSGPMWSILVYWDAWYSVETLRLAVKILLQVHCRVSSHNCIVRQRY